MLSKSHLLQLLSLKLVFLRSNSSFSSLLSSNRRDDMDIQFKSMINADVYSMCICKCLFWKPSPLADSQVPSSSRPLTPRPQMTSCRTVLPAASVIFVSIIIIIIIKIKISIFINIILPLTPHPEMPSCQVVVRAAGAPWNILSSSSSSFFSLVTFFADILFFATIGGWWLLYLRLDWWVTLPPDDCKNQDAIV